MQLIYVVQFILMCGLLGSIFFILDIMFKKDKYEILYFLILPPYILYFIWKNFDECKNAFYLSLIFLIVLIIPSLVLSLRLINHGEKSSDSVFISTA